MSVTERATGSAESTDTSVAETTHEISVKGKSRQVPAIRVQGAWVVVSGSMLRVAEVFDQYWLQAKALPDPAAVIRELSNSGAADLFTFAQRVPDTQPTYEFRREWDNVAVIPVSSHEHWIQKQVSSASRRNTRASEKKGVTVRVCPYDESYVRGIKSIYDESPVRHGRKYWHYGKSLEEVESENGTYRDRSTFLGAYYQGDLIGYMKIVWDERTAAIMQIVSKMQFFDRRPNNALLSAAVKLCEEKGIGYLQYEQFVYGKKENSSLTRFKRENGFVRMNVPRYYVPLTARGRAALTLGLHRSVKDRLPGWLVTALVDARDTWYAHRRPDANGTVQ